MNILVTSSTGFIGRYLVEWLVNNGYNVVSAGTSVEKAKIFPWFAKVKFTPCDYFAVGKDCHELFGRPDLLIHRAWKNLPNYMARFHIRRESSHRDAAITRGDAEFPMSGGEQLRDYLPVEKVAEYICRIALSKESGIVNCCSGETISGRRLVEERIASSSSSIKLKTGVYGYLAYEGMAFWGDTTRLREVIRDA